MKTAEFKYLFSFIQNLKCVNDAVYQQSFQAFSYSCRQTSDVTHFGKKQNAFYLQYSLMNWTDYRRLISYFFQYQPSNNNDVEICKLVVPVMFRWQNFIWIFSPSKKLIKQFFNIINRLINGYFRSIIFFSYYNIVLSSVLWH